MVPTLSASAGSSQWACAGGATASPWPTVRSMRRVYEVILRPLRDDFGALVDVGVAERAQRVEDLLVHVRAAQQVAPRGGGDGERHLGLVLEEQHVVAALELVDQLLELGARLRGRAGPV